MPGILGDLVHHMERESSSECGVERRLGSLNYYCDCERSYREDRMDQRIAMRVRRGTCIIVHARALRLARLI